HRESLGHRGYGRSSVAWRVFCGEREHGMSLSHRRSMVLVGDVSAMLPAYPRVSLYDTVQMLGPICARMPAFRTETLSLYPTGTGLGCPARCPWRFAGLWRECWGVFLRLDGAVWTIDKDGKGTAANDSCA